MYKLRNAVIALLLITARTEGVSAQSVVENNQKETKINQEVNPSVLIKTIVVDPYEYSTRKKADEQMVTYSSEVAKEKALQSEKERAAEEAKKKEQTKTKTYIDPRNDFTELYQKAGSAFGINPSLLRAVHMVETGGSGSTSKGSYAGAKGPMQFMPATFRAYGVDGNGDGSADITNVDDAVFTAAKYLAANGGMNNVNGALWHYNHSYAYVNKVISIARSLGM